jgi:hypothetical protein
MVEEQEAEKAVGTQGTLKGQWLMTSLKTSWCHGPRLLSTFLAPLTPSSLKICGSIDPLPSEPSDTTDPLSTKFSGTADRFPKVHL